MQDLTTEEFCRRFGACKAGVKFARGYATMRACYDALLCGYAGDRSAEWAVWVATRDGVMPKRRLSLFAVRCARRVQKLMRDERSLRALDAAERYTNGEDIIEDLEAACDAAPVTPWAAAAAYAAAMTALGCGARWAAAAAYAAVDAVAERSARATASHATCTVNLAVALALAERKAAENTAQLRILAELGNPFREVNNE